MNYTKKTFVIAGKDAANASLIPFRPVNKLFKRIGRKNLKNY
jgi:hypothetical protein